MNRRDFIKTVSASGMAVVAPISLTSKVSATELTPVGKYFIFAHLGGGWEPTTFCNPKGNELRSNISASARMGGSPVNKYPASAIRSAKDVYAGTATIADEMVYAPYLGTFNQEGMVGDDTVRDDGNANDGLTTRHIQQILSGTIAGAVLTAADSSVAWLSNQTDRDNAIANATAIIEGDVTTVNLGEFGADGTREIIDRNLDFNAANNTMPANLFVYDAFVCLHADQLRVLNGVDNRTNSHSTGTMYADTGSMAMGYPDFSALYAAVKGADRPLAWMTDGGGNSQSAGLVARSAASDANFFGIIADPLDGRTTEFDTHLSTAQAARKQVQSVKDSLPLRRRYQDQLYLVRDQGLEFASVAGEIVNPAAGTPAAIIKTAANNNNRRDHMRIAASGFASGMASSMQVGFGGFDTHGDHDNRHFFRIRDVLSDLHFLFRALDAYGVKDQTTICVGSDFGRTPWYNAGDGKDHWAVTSYMLLGNGVTGGTQVNGTNGLVEAENVDPNTMAVSSSGTRMTASHIHRELRKFAGIEFEELAMKFPVEAEDMSILG